MPACDPTIYKAEGAPESEIKRSANIILYSTKKGKPDSASYVYSYASRLGLTEDFKIPKGALLYGAAGTAPYVRPAEPG